MKHHPEDFQRTTMPEQISRHEKRLAGRAPTHQTPVVVRGHHVDIGAHHREFMRERLGLKLGKFAPAIERICVRIEDLNGPKGGVDHVCRIQVTMSRMGVVIVEERHADVIAAFHLAEERVFVAVEQRIGRAREGRIPAHRRARERAMEASAR